MKKIKAKKLIAIVITSLIALTAPLSGCSSLLFYEEDKIQIVTTTTIAKDIVDNIVLEVGEFETSSLMPSGVDPHSYTPSARDVLLLQNADVVVYSGLDLEGKMEDVFYYLNETDKTSIALSDGIDEDLLIKSSDSDECYDPHFWFDPTLYAQAALHFYEKLSEQYPIYAQTFESNLGNYLSDIEKTDEYCLSQIEKIPQKSRILITAHDAFSYFGVHYGFEVLSLAGISTQDEASTTDIITLADTIANNNIKAIFTESSTSSKSIQSLQAAVLARGASVEIGGELYSDSLGESGTDAESYIGTLKANVNTIVTALS